MTKACNTQIVIVNKTVHVSNWEHTAHTKTDRQINYNHHEYELPNVGPFGGNILSFT